VNDCPSSVAAGIAEKLCIPSAGKSDKAEIDRIARHRCGALESLPDGLLPRERSQKARAAGDFNFRRPVHIHSNRAPSVPAPATDDRGLA
jgi:hypothetical protein